jgi:hypothetical protein
VVDAVNEAGELKHGAYNSSSGGGVQRWSRFDKVKPCGCLVNAWAVSEWQEQGTSTSSAEGDQISVSEVDHLWWKLQFSIRECGSRDVGVRGRVVDLWSGG